MRRLLLLVVPLTFAACYPRYTKMEPADVPPAQTEHRSEISAPSYTAGPTQESTHSPDVAPDHYHN
jgi:hypothetical protein